MRECSEIFVSCLYLVHGDADNIKGADVTGLRLYVDDEAVFVLLPRSEGDEMFTYWSQSPCGCR
jgi:hypothetical protein